MRQNIHDRVGMLAGLTLITSPTAHAPGGWPVIRPVHAQYTFIAPPGPGVDTPFTLHFEDMAGPQIYKFECHAGGAGDESEMSWTGLFQCALFPTKGNTVTAVNLLASDTREEQSKDWWNRGRVLASQFQAPCLDYPEYSTLRHFKLRGMDLTLSFTDVAWGAGKEPALQKFTLTVDAAPDLDAKSPMAEKADGSRPPKACYP